MNGLLRRLDFRTAGESHGPQMTATLEGLPRGLAVDLEAVDAALRLRQGGAGRGGRQRIESDRVEVPAGLRRGRTIGSPLLLVVKNRDATIDELPEPSRPRPGHADLAGCYHWLDRDIRSTLERASARETCARVAAGAICAQLLAAVGTEVLGFVRSVHAAVLPSTEPGPAPIAELRRRRDASRLYTLADAADAAMLERVQVAAAAGDTVGGVVEVVVRGVLPGLGSCVQWDQKLDARLAAALMSIPAVKGVELGAGFAVAAAFGSEVHDAILPAVRAAALPRATNRAGGLEGGMTNGADLVVRAAMKPISTLRKPLDSVDLATGAASPAGYERSDVCAVSACALVAEAMVALVLADAALERIGGEGIDEFVARAAAHRAACARLGGD